MTVVQPQGRDDPRRAHRDRDGTGPPRWLALAGAAVAAAVAATVVVELTGVAPTTPSAQRRADPPPATGLDAGAEVEVRVEPGGRTLTVTEIVRWPDEAPEMLALAWPTPDVLTGAASDLQPSVRDLVLDADGQEVVAPDVSGPTPWTVELPEQTSLLRLTYVLDGSVLLSDSTVPGRALAVFSPLADSATGTQRVIVRVDDTALLNVACPIAAGTAPAPCGGRSEGDWVISLDTDGPGVVLLQLDLSRLA